MNRFEKWFDNNKFSLNNTFFFSYPPLWWDYTNYVRAEYIKDIKEKTIIEQRKLVEEMEVFIKDNNVLFKKIEL